jgi:hypothetical protein
MNDELERMWEEVVVNYFKALSRHSPGRTEENHEKPSGYSMSRPRSEPEIAKIQATIVTA